MIFDFEGARVVQGGWEIARLWAELVLGLGFVRDSLFEHAEDLLGLVLVQVTRIARDEREGGWVLWETQEMFGMLFQEVRLGKVDEWGRETVAWVEGTSVACSYEKAMVTAGRVSVSNIFD